MNPNMNLQGPPPPPSNESYNEYHPFVSNPSSWQESSVRSRGQSHYQGQYSTANPRIHPYGDNSQRGRYSYNRRMGSHRPYNRDRNFDHQQSQDNREQQTTTTNFSNRSLFRMNMLEDPWFHMRPKKVPADGTTLALNSEHD